MTLAMLQSEYFGILTQRGCVLSRVLPDPDRPGEFYRALLGPADVLVALQESTYAPGAFWLLYRDMGWIGANQATHLMLITECRKTDDNLRLTTREGEEFIVDFEWSGEQREIRERWRTWVAEHRAEYDEAERIQRPTLMRMIAEMEESRSYG